MHECLSTAIHELRGLLSNKCRYLRLIDTPLSSIAGATAEVSNNTKPRLKPLIKLDKVTKVDFG